MAKMLATWCLTVFSERKSRLPMARLLSPAISIFAEGLFTHREQLIKRAPDGLPLGEFGLFTVPAENPFNPFGVPVGVD